ncbi:MAG TPA: GIY-YIG nuclease family protein, partial [Patescibacteria group bacterium]
MKNFSPKTIKLFLLDGDPTGAKKVQLSNWSGMAFVIPRNKLEVVNKREELDKQCLYFLVGGTSISSEVYIGEAENFQKR